MKKYYSLFLTFFLIALGVFYFATHPLELEVLTTLSINSVIKVATMLFLFFLTTGLTFYLLIRLVNIHLNFSEVIGLTFLTNFVNYLAPTRPGAAAKAVYLKMEKNLPYSVFSSVFAANAFIVMLISGFFGFLLMLVWWLDTGQILFELLMVCLGLTCFSILPFILNMPLIERGGRFWNILNNALTGFETIKSQGNGIRFVCASVILQFITSAILMQVAYSAIGQSLSITNALIIGVFTSIANFFTLTPNNIGIQEIVMGYLFAMTGMVFSDGVLVGSLIRAVHLILTFILTPMFVYLMLRHGQVKFRQLI